MNEEPDYATALRELKEIVSQLDDSDINIDDLEVKVKRASELLTICKKKLYETEEKVMKALEDLNPSP